MDVAELPLVGGHPALDLVNTVERGTPTPGTRPRDHLADPPALLRWVRRAGLVDDAEEAAAVAEDWGRDPGSGDAALAAVRDVREALHTVLLAATGTGPADPGVVAAALGGCMGGGRGRSRARGWCRAREVARLAVGGRRPSSFPTGPPTSPWTCSAGPTWPACGAARRAGVRLDVPGPESQRLAPVVPDGRLRVDGEGSPPHRAAGRPGASRATCKVMDGGRMTEQRSTRTAVVALLALAVSTFVYVTTETLPIGLLLPIAADLGVGPSAAGLLVTWYGLVVVAASIPLTQLTRQVPRRPLLSGLLAVFVLATWGSALASSYRCSGGGW
jgi:hypothetical protein